LGSIPSISANGNENGIAWAISGAGSGSLIAYDAANLSQLFSDNLAGYLEFVVPTIADSKVFASAGSAIAVYGELPQATPVIASTVNAASFAANALSPGSLFSIFGSALAPMSASAPSTPLPLTLADVSVTVNGIAAPLLYVSAQQINAQIPSTVQPGPASVVVRVSGSVSEQATATVTAAAPGIFTGAENQAAALNADGSANRPDNPASVSSVVSVFFTGPGPVQAVPADGEAAPVAIPDPLATPATATIGGMPAQIQFAGLAPGWVGLGQINMKIPALGSGTFPVVITIGSSVSNPGNLSVQ
jgi:uncharacterized protein (TIGR03437 family)